MRRDINFSIDIQPGAVDSSEALEAAFDAEMSRLNGSLGLREVSRSVDVAGVVRVKLKRIPGER